MTRICFSGRTTAETSVPQYNNREEVQFQKAKRFRETRNNSGNYVIAYTHSIIE
jgi:hypothetical protein